MVLSGCGNKNGGDPFAASGASAASAQDSKIALLQDISGVWNSPSEGALVTINYSNSTLQMLSGNTFLPITLGDVDAGQGTVNLHVSRNGAQEIWTIKKEWNEDHTAYHLILTLANGSQETLAFVRKISNDDLNQIARLSMPAAGTPASAPAPTASSQGQSGASGSLQMYVGDRDTYLRTCPGVTCAAIIVIPKNSEVTADTSTIQKPAGTNASWVRVSYSGPYCSPATLNQEVGCVSPTQTSNPVTGWLNYALLSQSPSDDSTSSAGEDSDGN